MDISAPLTPNLSARIPGICCAKGTKRRWLARPWLAVVVATRHWLLWDCVSIDHFILRPNVVATGARYCTRVSIPNVSQSSITR